MSNSPMVGYVKMSPNNSGIRTMKIDRITPHCVVGQLSAESIGEIFQPKERKASSNYGIGYDGLVGLYVPENMRSWCSSSWSNDQRAITIECASDKTHPYAFNDTVYKTLIELCTDICKRNGKTKLLWLNDRETTLNYKPAENEMVLSVHRWFDNRECPGDWLYSRMKNLADSVTSKLAEDALGYDLYRVQVGAFRVKSNAENYLKKVQDAGFPDAFIAVVKDYYK